MDIITNFVQYIFYVQTTVMDYTTIPFWELATPTLFAAFTTIQHLLAAAKQCGNSGGHLNILFTV